MAASPTPVATRRASIFSCQKVLAWPKDWPLAIAEETPDGETLRLHGPACYASMLFGFQKVLAWPSFTAIGLPRVPFGLLCRLARSAD